MRVSLFVFLSFLMSLFAKAQYDIKINFKGCTDSTVYLVTHLWESNNILDSCKKVKNGQIRFQGKKSLEKGFYILVNQGKNATYFEFFVGDNQKFSISTDFANVKRNLKTVGSKENELYFEYERFFC